MSGKSWIPASVPHTAAAQYRTCDRSHKFRLCSVGVRSSVVAAEALALLFSCSLWPGRSRELVRAIRSAARLPVGKRGVQMSNFLRWRKMTWAFVLWSGYIATWAVIAGSGPANVTLWWLVGMTVLGSLQTLARARRPVL